MGRKIFVSYKYADDQVENLPSQVNSTVRDYVTLFEDLIDSSDHIYKGESDGEDLSIWDDDTIWQKLRDRIYDSSITIVFISPGMRESRKKDRDQWIPWEISYSLKETSRKNKNGDSITSKTNAMIAVVLPDITGSYSYYLESKTCCNNHCTMHHTEKLFQILKENKFNRKSASHIICSNGKKIWDCDCSYIAAVKWNVFKNNYDEYISSAYERQKNIDDYDIVKTIKYTILGSFYKNNKIKMS